MGARKDETDHKELAKTLLQLALKQGVHLNEDKEETHDARDCEEDPSEPLKRDDVEHSCNDEDCERIAVDCEEPEILHLANHQNVLNK